MGRYIIRRLLTSIPVVILVVSGVFLLLHIAPGDPAVMILGEQASPHAVHVLRVKLGLNLPLWMQYVRWWNDLLHLNFGMSITDNEPVLRLISQRLPVTLELSLVAMILALLIAIPTGIGAALRPNTWIDYMARLLALTGVSIPNFWLALLLMYVFAFKLRWFPATGFVSLRHGLLANLHSLFLPALTLALALAAVTSRLLRSDLMDALIQNYVRTARAKGLAGSVVVLKHALRNALIPVVTVVGMQVGLILGGVVITETVFAIPGMGSLVVNGIFNHDYPVVQGTVLFMALIIIVTNLIVDLLYAVLDPRIQYQ